MLSFPKITIFSFLAILFASASVLGGHHSLPTIKRGGVEYESGYNATYDIHKHPNKGLRLIMLNGDQANYNLTTKEMGKDLPENVHCAYTGDPKDETSLKFISPCTTSTIVRKQFVTCTCQNDPNSKVTMTFYPATGKDKDPEGRSADAITHGNAKAGFILDGKDQALNQSPSSDKPMISTKPDAGIAVDCGGSSSSATGGSSNSTSSNNSTSSSNSTISSDSASSRNSDNGSSSSDSMISNAKNAASSMFNAPTFLRGTFVAVITGTAALLS